MVWTSSVLCAMARLAVALALISFASAVPGSASASAAAPSFTIENDEFVQDGKVAHLRAGCVHYSRVPAEYWEDRLLRLKAMGLNAIQTYVPWNWHEPVRGEFNWEGDRDLGQFLATAQKVGLLVVLRAGPYMCGEWCAPSPDPPARGAKMHTLAQGVRRPAGLALRQRLDPDPHLRRALHQLRRQLLEGAAAAAAQESPTRPFGRLFS